MHATPYMFSFADMKMKNLAIKQCMLLYCNKVVMIEINMGLRYPCFYIEIRLRGSKSVYGLNNAGYYIFILVAMPCLVTNITILHIFQKSNLKESGVRFVSFIVPIYVFSFI